MGTGWALLARITRVDPVAGVLSVIEIFSTTDKRTTQNWGSSTVSTRVTCG